MEKDNLFNEERGYSKEDHFAEIKTLLEETKKEMTGYFSKKEKPVETSKKEEVPRQEILKENEIKEEMPVHSKSGYFLIIDGSSLLGHLYYGSHRRGEDSSFMKDSRGRITNGVTLFVKKIAQVLREQKPTYLAICWDESREKTFRRERYAKYKENRKDDPELKRQMAYVREVLEKAGVKQFSYPKYEADDFAGSLTEHFKKETHIRLYTKDADFLQLVEPGVALWMIQKHADREAFMKKHGLDPKDPHIPSNAIKITEKVMKEKYHMASNQVVLFKAFSGDKGDNIPGVPKVGAKGAYAGINTFSSLEEIEDILKKSEEEQLAFLEEKEQEIFSKEEETAYLEKGQYKTAMKMLLKKLREESEEGLSGMDFFNLSYELATIKRDIRFKTTLSDMAVGKISLEKMKEAASLFDIRL